MSNDRHLSEKVFLKQPQDYPYNNEYEGGEFFADIFANNNYTLSPLDINTNVGLAKRLKVIDQHNINLRNALQND